MTTDSSAWTWVGRATSRLVDFPADGVIEREDAAIE